MGFDTVRRLRAPMIALALLGGCSSYSGQYVSDVGDQKAQITGIPITLPKPIYRLQRTLQEGTKKPALSLTVEYVPDPAHRYDIMLSPGLFVDPDWTLSLRSDGIPSSSKAIFAETITPTINALGSFAGNLIGAFAKGVFDAGSTRGTIAQWLKDDKSDACKKARETVSFASPKKPGMTGGALAERAEAFADDAEFRAGFFWLTTLERNCLSAVLNDKRKADVFKAAKEEYAKTYTTADDQAFVAVLDKVFTQIDGKTPTEAREMLKAAAEKYIPTTLGEPLLGARSKVFTAASRMINDKVAPGSSDMLEKIVKLEPDTRRARYVAYLEREAEKLRFDLAARENSKERAAQIQAQLRDIDARRADALDAREISARAQALREFLARVRDKAIERGGRAPATAEYAAVRQELELLQNQIAARRAALAQAVTPIAPPVEAKKDIHVQLKPKSFLDDKTAHQKPGAPDYIIVLEEVQ